MSDNKVEHLKMIQMVVTRLGQNSFSVRGWAVVLTSALLSLSAASSEAGVALVAVPAVLVLWGLDAYYLWQERLFRQRYNEVRLLSESEIDFAMLSTKKSLNGEAAALSETGLLGKRFEQFTSTVFSVTVFPFHVVLLVVSVVCWCTQR